MFLSRLRVQSIDYKVKVKLEKSIITMWCGKMQAVTTLCRFQFGVMEVRAVLSALTLEFVVLKWSARPRVRNFLLLHSYFQHLIGVSISIAGRL